MDKVPHVDPNTLWWTLRETVKALNAHHDHTQQRQRAVELLALLAQWLRHGGFPPHVSGDPMNPNTAWQVLCEALRELYNNPDDKVQRERAVDVLNVLAQWLQQGGFPPVMED
jgi:phosphoenolpyruvate-protein kinase (PTS system EI component)